MKKLLVAGIAAAALYSAPALAADYPAKAGPAPDPFNWSGFYIGVNGGGVSSSATGHFPQFVVPPGTFDSGRKESGLAGLHGGFQSVWGNFLLGVEASWDAVLGDKFSNKGGSGLSNVGCGVDATFSCQARLSDVLTVGPRAGFTMGQWLIYGTGGYARAGVDARVVLNATGAPQEVNTLHHVNGWFGGGGVEFFVMRNLTLGVEYKHYDFKKFTVQGSTIISDVKDKADAVLLRLTIK